MANVELNFLTSEIGDYQTKLKCYLNDSNKIFIQISNINDNEWEWITLDKSTAIKLAKTLRTEINKMEVENG